VVPVPADSEWRIACERGNLLGPLAFFVCHSLLIEMPGLAAIFSCHHATLVHVDIVCVCDSSVCMCSTAVQYTAHLTNASFSRASTPPACPQYLYLDRARLRIDTRPIAVSLLRPGPHGSVGAASTRALDQIPECSSMIGSVASLFRHPGTLLDNHAIYSSPCIHSLLT
jgi:hypothetical protein